MTNVSNLCASQFCMIRVAAALVVVFGAIENLRGAAVLPSPEPSKAVNKMANFQSI
ncbi:MAG TPA: hypothetical protein VM711_05400 [Sphingomicrobium sp.]|nr:hypothetical protein [Sphingomicrobium sp.]